MRRDKLLAWADEWQAQSRTGPEYEQGNEVAAAVLDLAKSAKAAEAKLAEVERELAAIHASGTISIAAEAQSALAAAEAREKALREALEGSIGKWEREVEALQLDSNPQGVFRADKYLAILDCIADVRAALAVPPAQEAADAAAIRGEVAENIGAVCACGHLHLANPDGSDGGCKICNCGNWRPGGQPSPAVPPAQGTGDDAKEGV